MFNGSSRKSVPSENASAGAATVRTPFASVLSFADCIGMYFASEPDLEFLIGQCDRETLGAQITRSQAITRDDEAARNVLYDVIFTSSPTWRRVMIM
jgi:hypothetical protein